MPTRDTEMRVLALMALVGCAPTGREVVRYDTAEIHEPVKDTGRTGDTGGADTGPADTATSDTGRDTGSADTGPADTGGSDTGPGDTGGADTADGDTAG